MDDKRSDQKKDSPDEQVCNSSKKTESDLLIDALNSAKQAVDGAAKAAESVTKEPGYDGPRNRTFLMILVFLGFIAIVGLIAVYKGTVDKVIERIPVSIPPGEVQSRVLSNATTQNPMPMPELGTHVQVDANKRWNAIATVTPDKRYIVSVTGHWSNNKAAQKLVPFVDYQGKEDPSPNIKTEVDREQYWKSNPGDNTPLVPRYKVAALIGQIGANSEFLLEPHGKDNPWTPADGGNLYAFINDGDAGKGLNENQGNLTVTIEEVK